jgi:hypothetical protein
MKTIIVAALVAAFSTTAQAVDIELSGGYSKLTKGDNGTWYQDPFPSTIKLGSLSGSIGIRFNKENNNYWRAGYTYFGQSTSEAVATASDENYNPNNPPTYCNGECWDMSHWYGHGVVQGLYVSKVFGFQPYGREIDLEAGLFVYNASWTMTIPDWKHCKDCKPEYLQVKRKNIPSVTPFFSVGIDNVFLSYYARVQANGGGWPAVFHGPAYKLEYRYSF